MLKNNLLDYQIIDAVEASIYWKDLSGKYLGCNRYMMKMAGLKREDIVGVTDYDLPWKKQADNITAIDKMVIENNKKYEIEETPTISGNVNKVFLSTKSPLIDDDGKVVGVIGVSIDITHFRKIRQEFEATERILKQYSSIKTRFLKNISHESRIPMGAVLSITESLKNNWDKFNEKIKRESIDLLFKEASRLSNFVLNTFDVSSFAKNEVTLNLKKHDFLDVLKCTIDRCKQSFLHDKVNINIETSGDYVFSFDRQLIEKVIENLLMNAVQYSPTNKNISIKVSRSHIANTNIPAMCCSVTDEGVGVPDKELKLIFEAFSESSRTASKACGVGLGLNLCKEIIDEHHGEIWGENNESKSGATFYFTLPTNLLSLSTGEPNTSKENVKKRR